MKRKLQRKFKWGEKRRKIAEAIKLVMKGRITGLSFSLSTEDLRQDVKLILPSLNIFSLDIINAIRKDQQLGQNMSIGQQDGVEIITLYSSELKLALGIVQEKIRRKNLTLVPKRAAA